MHGIRCWNIYLPLQESAHGTQQGKTAAAECSWCQSKQGVIIVVLNTKGVLSGFGFFFHSSRKLSEHFIAILVEKSVTEWVWSSGLVLGQDLHLGLFHSVIQMKFSGQNVKVVVGNEQKASENSAVFSSVQPSLLIGQICQLSAIKQPFYFFTARQCFNSLKAFCCGYKLKVWCSYDSINFFFSF